ncbi:uncharacterized protein LOC142625099 [Castanea sativa]|uniref:uncharacterized protein LOC142625099 n=1 Tax=Castanea sativa TaxID=21020 RepID=UPI003F6510A5
MDGKSVGIVSLQEPTSWKVYVDGVANQRGSGVGLVIVSPKMIMIEKSLKLSFSATNNEVEYKAFLARMAMVQKVEGELEAKDPRMQEYLNQVRHLQSKFESFTLVQVPRSRNTHVDSLATLATSSAQGLLIPIEDLCKPTEMKGDMVRVHQIKVGPSWMDSIVLFLKEDILPKEKSEADKATGNRRWLLVDTDYFIKWVEAEPLSNIRDLVARRFIWKYIVTRFGTPYTLISDNGLQFDSKAFRRYGCDLGITNRYSTPAYP